jgi:DNA-binding MarR family transcriptional regulator
MMNVNVGVKTATKYKVLSDLEKRIFLFVAEHQDKKLSISKVANVLAINQTLVSRILKSMEENQLITKVRDEKNQKIKHPELTTNGKELMTSLKGNEQRKALILFF